jgi:single-strand DNA-binding protein
MKQALSLIGRVGRDPEMRYTPGGQAVTSFSVATSEKFTSKAGEKVEKTIWFRVSTWGKLAEVCNTYVKKGMLVSVDGKLTAGTDGNPRMYDKQDGTKATNFEVVAHDVKFLSRVEGSEVNQTAIEDDTELPF